jgi:enoyl-CoA hydratase/carnithine racemase
MDVAWVHELAAAVEAVAADPSGVALVLIRGAGRAFCAGLDLDMMSAEGMPPEFYPAQERAFAGLEALDRLVLAQIHGYCLGGGLQLALACDIRIACDDAVLGLPAALEGLPPGMAPWRLPRFVGLGRAMRLAVGGERLGAAEAERIGLVDHVLPAEGFDEAARIVVERYRAVPAAAARATKTLIRRAFDEDFTGAFARSQELVRQSLDSPAAAAARSAWAARKADPGR